MEKSLSNAGHACLQRQKVTHSVYGLKSEIQFYTHKQHENAKIGDTWCQYLSSQKSIIPDLAARRAAWNQYLWLGEETAEWEDLRVELLLNLSVRQVWAIRKETLLGASFEDVPYQA